MQDLARGQGTQGATCASYHNSKPDILSNTTYVYPLELKLEGTCAYLRVRSQLKNNMIFQDHVFPPTKATMPTSLLLEATRILGFQGRPRRGEAE